MTTKAEEKEEAPKLDFSEHKKAVERAAEELPLKRESGSYLKKGTSPQPRRSRSPPQTREEKEEEEFEMARRTEEKRLAAAAERPAPERPKEESRKESKKEGERKEQKVDCHEFRAMLSTTLERMALVCDFCANDIPARQTYWHCTTCHQTHEFEREGGCDICAACYLSSLHKMQGPLPTKELLERRGALTLGPSPDAPFEEARMPGGRNGHSGYQSRYMQSTAQQQARNGRPQTAQATGVRGATSSQYHRAVTGGANDGRPMTAAQRTAAIGAAYGGMGHHPPGHRQAPPATAMEAIRASQAAQAAQRDRAVSSAYGRPGSAPHPQAQRRRWRQYICAGAGRTSAGAADAAAGVAARGRRARPTGRPPQANGIMNGGGRYGSFDRNAPPPGNMAAGGLGGAAPKASWQPIASLGGGMSKAPPNGREAWNNNGAAANGNGSNAGPPPRRRSGRSRRRPPPRRRARPTIRRSSGRAALPTERRPKRWPRPRRTSRQAARRSGTGRPSSPRTRGRFSQRSLRMPRPRLRRSRGRAFLAARMGGR